MDISELYKEYSNTIYHVCNRYLKESEASRDAVQDIFVKVHLKSYQFEGRSETITWLYRIAINHCLDYLKVQRKRKYITEFHSYDFWENLRAEVHNEVDKKRLVDEILYESDQDVREIVTMYYMESLNKKDISEILGISRVSIAKRLRKFKKQVLERYSDFRIEDEEDEGNRPSKRMLILKIYQEGQLLRKFHGVDIG